MAMIDTFDSDLFSFIFTVVVPILAVLFIFLLILLFISRLKNTPPYDRHRERAYEKELRREQAREMKERRRGAKHSSELPEASQVIISQSVQGIWTRLLNAIKTLIGSEPSQGVAEGESRNAQRNLRDDRDMETEQQTLNTTPETGGIEGVHWELTEIRRSIAKLARQNDSYQDELSEELRQIRLLLERSVAQGTTRHSQERPAEQRATHQESYSRSQRAESRSSQQKESGLEPLCRLYNAGVRDPSRQQAFKEQYRPIRIGATNYMECARDPSLSLEFGEDSNGYFEAIRAEDGRYVVVPRFNLIIQETQYGPGAVGKVFDCHNYTPGKTYRHIELIHPAIFITDGQNWEVDIPGELYLS